MDDKEYKLENNIDPTATTTATRLDQIPRSRKRSKKAAKFPYYIGFDSLA